MRVSRIIAAIALLLVATPAAAASVRGKVKARGVRKPVDIVVYIKKVDGDFPAPKKALQIDQKELVFNPHVLPLLRGTAVEFLNSEVKIQHNVFSPDAVAGKFNLGTYPPGQTRAYTFDKGCDGDDTCVAAVLCHVHPEMSAYVVVLQNPYFAVTDRRGKFEIKNLPPGEYELVAWHEKLRQESQTVTVGKDDLDIKLSMRR